MNAAFFLHSFWLGFGLSLYLSEYMVSVNQYKEYSCTYIFRLTTSPLSVPGVHDSDHELAG